MLVHWAEGEDNDSEAQFRVCRRDSVRRREDGDRGTSKSIGRSARVESSWGGDGGPADLKKTNWQGHEHLCDTGMPVRNGNIGNDRTTTAKPATTTKVASVRKQLRTNNSKSNEGRQENNCGVKGRDRSAEELDRETGEEHTTVGRIRRKDGGWQTTKRAAELREEGRRRRGRLMLIWEDCVERNVREAGEEGDWKKKTRYRGGWKRLSDEAVKKLRHHITSDKGKKRKRESSFS